MQEQNSFTVDSRVMNNLGVLYKRHEKHDTAKKCFDIALKGEAGDEVFRKS